MDLLREGDNQEKQVKVKGRKKGVFGFDGGTFPIKPYNLLLESLQLEVCSRP